MRLQTELCKAPHGWTNRGGKNPHYDTFLFAAEEETNLLMYQCCKSLWVSCQDLQESSLSEVVASLLQAEHLQNESKTSSGAIYRGSTLTGWFSGVSHTQSQLSNSAITAPGTSRLYPFLPPEAAVKVIGSSHLSMDLCLLLHLPRLATTPVTGFYNSQEELSQPSLVKSLTDMLTNSTPLTTLTDEWFKLPNSCTL